MRRGGAGAVVMTASALPLRHGTVRRGGAETVVKTVSAPTLKHCKVEQGGDKGKGKSKSMNKSKGKSKGKGSRKKGGARAAGKRGVVDHSLHNSQVTGGRKRRRNCLLTASPWIPKPPQKKKRTRRVKRVRLIGDQTEGKRRKLSYSQRGWSSVGWRHWNEQKGRTEGGRARQLQC